MWWRAQGMPDVPQVTPWDTVQHYYFSVPDLWVYGGWRGTQVQCQ